MWRVSPGLVPAAGALQSGVRSHGHLQPAPVGHLLLVPAHTHIKDHKNGDDEVDNDKDSNDKDGNDRDDGNMP
eukprot:1161462-Pelagomonas_calceolata.AAC.3